jgi:hypothetical protein
MVMCPDPIMTSFCVNVTLGAAIWLTRDVPYNFGARSRIR